MNCITVRNATVNYDGYVALRDLSLNVPQGTVCAVLGASGCGKSTLLKIIAGLLQPTSGEVLINGEAVDPRRQNISFMPQNYGLFPWQTIEENILLPLRIKKIPVDKKHLESLMRTLHLEGLNGRYPSELSGGQQQRVALARAFCLSSPEVLPQILLMDEPYSALDAITREEMRQVFKTTWLSYRVTTVLVTHDVEEALTLGKNIVIMAKEPGRVVKIMDNPLFDEDAPTITDNHDFFLLGKDIRRIIAEN